MLSFAIQIKFENIFPHSFERPIGYVHSKFIPDRAFVLEQRGKVFSIDLPTKKKKLILDLSSILSSTNEEGLLCMVVDPHFLETKKFYFYYTRAKSFFDRKSIVSSFIYDKENNAIEKGSEKIILEFKQPYPNHNGGQLAFGGDNYLYIGLGDGGAAYDPKNNGQNTKTLLGTIVRINVHQVSEERNYTIPKDNPFVGVKGFREEIFAYGLRNPWRFSFDKKTQEIFCADVGQNKAEEINAIRSGGNYGWPVYEGEISLKDEEIKDYEAPAFTYLHKFGASVTGGYVYRGNDKVAYGLYIFADYLSNNVWLIGSDNYKVYHRKKYRNLNISSFAEDFNGNLFACSFGKGKIFRLKFLK